MFDDAWSSAWFLPYGVKVSPGPVDLAATSFQKPFVSSRSSTLSTTYTTYANMSAEPSGKISLALGGSRKPARPAPTNGVKRSHAALHDGEDDDHGHGHAQTVSHFDQSAGGAIDQNNAPKLRAPLVIQPQANRDWREASQRNKRQRSAKVGELQNGVREQEERREQEKPSYGLNVFKKAEEENEVQTNGHATSGNHDDEMKDTSADANGDLPIQEMTADEEAMNALLGKATSSKTLILPAMTEEEAFERDYKTAPDMATLEDYARVPVEEFGAALLRGMGWKEGEGIGANKSKKIEQTKIPQRRPALLGIGAKEEAAVAQDLGTWGKAAKDRKGPVQVYNPVLLRDKKTGELFTEEELENKKAREEKEKYEMEFEREESRKEKERRRRDGSDSRDRDHDRRGKDSRKDRRDRNDRDRRRYDSDEEYYRKKDKERRRRERDRNDSDHDRDRSKRYDSDRDRHRDREKHRERRR